MFWTGFSCPMCQILPVSVDCPFLTAPLVFSYVYLLLDVYMISTFDIVSVLVKYMYCRLFVCLVASCYDLRIVSNTCENRK